MKNTGYIFSCMTKIRKSLRNKLIYLFLDYDGTLSPMANTPDKAVITPGIKDLLRKLSKLPNCKIAIVSGRALKDISKKIGLKGVVYVGNHGFEIKGPKIKFKSLISRKYIKIVKKIKAKLKKELSSFRGVFLEDKGYCLTLHYRLANANDISAITSKFYFATFIDEFRNNIHVKTGKMTREIRPPFIWNKGTAVLWLLGKQVSVFKNRGEKTLPVYIGDDVTDEDAFQVLRNRGLTIFVGRPQNTKARFYLKNTKDVEKFLEIVLKNKN